MRKHLRRNLLCDLIGHFGILKNVNISLFISSRACLVEISIPILLYADDIVLISDSPRELQRYLNFLKSFYIHNDLNLDQTKVMVSSTTQVCIIG